MCYISALSSSQRLKKTYISRPLTAEIARSIGIELYYAPCRRAFNSILRALDSQVCCISLISFKSFNV